MISAKKNVLVVILANMLIVAISIFVPNDFLIYNSFYLYGLQSIILIPYLLSKADKLYQVFTPSFFVLIYYLVNLSFGSYLLPRDFGFQKWYNNDIYTIKHYNIIVSYFLSCNLVLFTIAIKTIEKLKGKVLQDKLKVNFNSAQFINLFILLIIFFSVGFWEAPSFFSYQLIITIIVCISISSTHRFLRYIVYLLLLVLILKFNYENKREVVVILFSIVFIESSFSGWELNFSFKKISMYFGGIFLFFSLVLSASIMRGYGGFEKENFLDAYISIPKYIGQDIFIDGLTENLELNYNYGSAITSMNLILTDKIKYQYGATILKVVFIPIPRDVVSFKPESMMQIYTKKYQPLFWQEGGSLPVNISCDMFLNFSFGGIFIFALIWYILDNLFVSIFSQTKKNIRLFSLIFLTINILPLARGSGIEQYIIYYLYGLLFLLIYFSFKIVLRFNSENKQTSHSQLQNQ